MIKFNDIKQEEPYIILQEKYKSAIDAGQKNIEAISISSYDLNRKEVSSRFVNLKFIEGESFIFFTNYNSPKSISFKSHPQISALLYWNAINTQIRIKANICKTDIKFNKEYFKERSITKNALAISSNQSNIISSYEKVIKKYNETLKEKDLTECPDYWGGFAFIPYELEFWEGEKSRLNKRSIYCKRNNEWHHTFLEP